MRLNLPKLTSMYQYWYPAEYGGAGVVKPHTASHLRKDAISLMSIRLSRMPPEAETRCLR